MPLTLDLALAQVRQAGPDIRRAALETRARRAEVDQAGRRLNPSIGLEVENFSGSGSFSGIDQSETTLAFEQTFQLGNKRIKRQRAAQALATLGDAECRAILRQTELETALTFYELQASQRLAELADETANLARALEETVEKRVEAGAAAPPELSRARADAYALQAAALAARSDVNQRRYDLAALWGSANPQFAPPGVVTKSILTSDVVGTGNVSEHPAIAAAHARADALDAEQIAARAAGVPDLTVSAGIRQFENTGNTAFLVGVSLPIPVFDRNRDAARAAGYRANAERVGAIATETRLRSRQQAAAAQVRASQQRLSLLEQEALPAARSAYDATVQGYTSGRFDLTTTLDARKGLIEAGVSVIDANRTLNADLTRLKSLIGAAPFNGDIQ